jgi:hypothetical protein
MDIKLEPIENEAPRTAIQLARPLPLLKEVLNRMTVSPSPKAAWQPPPEMPLMPHPSAFKDRCR